MNRQQLFGILAASMIIGVIGAQSARAIIIAQDTFTSPNGSPIVGRTTELGNLVWSTQGGGSATIQGHGASLNNAATVLFSPTGYASFAVEAQFDLRSGTSWGMLGFGQGTDAPNNENAPLWVYLDNADNGLWQLVSGGSLLAQNYPAPGYVADGYNTLKLAYDVGTSNVTLTINGTVVYDQVPTQTIDLSLIVAAGFASDGPTNLPEVDNFLLTAEVPEPSVALLAVVGGFLLWRRRQRNR